MLPKVSEAEVFARGGIRDVLVSNQVRDPAKIDRMVQLPKLGARTICCVDDIDNVAELSAATQTHGTEIECLVEIDCGAGRCGVAAGEPVVELAKAIAAAPGLKFAGIQAYQGAMQHLQDYSERKEKSTSRLKW
ncbi:alanine racemase [Aliamphritea spongicola]|nr:alanine racemase [Aliamphritea spongicola]